MVVERVRLPLGVLLTININLMELLVNLLVGFVVLLPIGLLMVMLADRIDPSYRMEDYNKNE